MLNKQQLLKAALDKHIAKTAQQYAAENGGPQPQDLQAAARFLWSIYWLEVGNYWLYNQQDGFIYWLEGGSAATITMTTREAIDYLHACGYYGSSQDQEEKNALRMLNCKLYMRIARLMGGADHEQ